MVNELAHSSRHGHRCRWSIVADIFCLVSSGHHLFTRLYRIAIITIVVIVWKNRFIYSPSIFTLSILSFCNCVRMNDERRSGMCLWDLLLRFSIYFSSVKHPISTSSVHTSNNQNLIWKLAHNFHGFSTLCSSSSSHISSAIRAIPMRH